LEIQENDPGNHSEAGAQDFARDDALGGLPAKAIKGQFVKAVNGSHTVAVGAPGALGPEGPQVGSGAALDQEKVEDVLLYVEYRVGAL
jgi:hypothetical protein